MREKLTWNESTGIGYYPVEESPYDASYFQKYVEYENSEIGVNLNKARRDLVAKLEWNSLLDIGVGSGIFIRDLDGAYGYDINPAAVEYLQSIDKYKEPFEVDVITFWDSLEHIHNPDSILSLAKRFVVISTPIYNDLEHIYNSKHFRPDEHCWYFTKQGMINFMATRGFDMIEYNTMESDLGREDIGTFVFINNKQG